MTTDHYEWVQARMRDEIKGNHTSSIWLACAFFVAGAGISLRIAVVSATLSSATKGEFEVAYWGALLITCMLVVFHLTKWNDSDKRATALIKEMDLHRFDVVVPPVRSES